MEPQIAAVLGAGVGIGIALILYGVHLHRVGQESSVDTASFNASPVQARLRRYWARALATAAIGAAVWWWTGWPVAAVAAAALVWWSKAVFGPDTAGKAAVTRVEAVAAWTESIRDVVAAGAGLKQALIAVARFTPPALATEAATLAEQARSGRISLVQALRDFAADVDDETADLVVLALIAAHRRAGDLAALLDRLARTARAEAAMRTRVIASRARIRAAARLISGTAIAITALLVLLSPEFLTFYDTMIGQAALALVFAVFAHALLWLARMGRYARPARLIDLGGTS
jgi:tight adherence protein B